jgi:hypothetical protein
MLLRTSLFAMLPILVLTACKTPYKESDEKRKAEKKNAQDDPMFQAFLGRLRIAVQKRDRATLQQMMTPTFGYRWDDGPPGDSVFTYWDLHNTWTTLNATLQAPFVPYSSAPGELYMVTSPDHRADGYIAGIQLTGGAWRFSYFLPPDPTGGGE